MFMHCLPPRQYEVTVESENLAGWLDKYFVTKITVWKVTNYNIEIVN